MFNLRKNIFALIFIISFVLFLISPLFIRAQVERELEVDYPIIDAWRPETVEQDILPAYVKYIFNFAIAISGLIVFGALIYGGVRWMTSAGNPTALSDARDQILSSFLGLIILLSSYLILTTIDPQLVTLRLPTLLRVRTTETPGVYLSLKTPFPSDTEIAGGEKVYHTTFSVSDLRDMVGDEIKSLKTVSQYVIGREGEEETQVPLGFYYGGILHKKKSWEGDCVIHSTFNEGTYTINDIVPADPESITVFQEVETSEGEVKLCSEANVIGTEEEENLCQPFNVPQRDFTALPTELDKKVWQVEVPKGWLLVLKGPGKCATFDKSVSDLKGYSINKCLGWSWADWWWIWKSCATQYALFPTKK